MIALNHQQFIAFFLAALPQCLQCLLSTIKERESPMEKWSRGRSSAEEQFTCRTLVPVAHSRVARALRSIYNVAVCV